MAFNIFERAKSRDDCPNGALHASLAPKFRGGLKNRALAIARFNIAPRLALFMRNVTERADTEIIAIRRPDRLNPNKYFPLTLPTNYFPFKRLKSFLGNATNAFPARTYRLYLRQIDFQHIFIIYIVLVIISLKMLLVAYRGYLAPRAAFMYIKNLRL